MTSPYLGFDVQHFPERLNICRCIGWIDKYSVFTQYLQILRRQCCLHCPAIIVQFVQVIIYNLCYSSFALHTYCIFFSSFLTFIHTVYSFNFKHIVYSFVPSLPGQVNGVLEIGCQQKDSRYRQHHLAIFIFQDIKIEIRRDTMIACKDPMK